MISVSIVHWLMGEKGWTFESDEYTTPDLVNGSNFLYQVYTKANPNYSGRVTVPVLWDKKNNTIVSNESSEIIRMFNSEFDKIGAKILRSYVDRLNASPAYLEELSQDVALQMLDPSNSIRRSFDSKFDVDDGFVGLKKFFATAVKFAVKAAYQKKTRGEGVLRDVQERGYGDDDLDPLDTVERDYRDVADEFEDEMLESNVIRGLKKHIDRKFNNKPLVLDMADVWFEMAKGNRDSQKIKGTQVFRELDKRGLSGSKSDMGRAWIALKQAIVDYFEDIGVQMRDETKRWLKVASKEDAIVAQAWLRDLSDYVLGPYRMAKRIEKR